MSPTLDLHLGFLLEDSEVFPFFFFFLLIKLPKKKRCFIDYVRIYYRPEILNYLLYILNISVGSSCVMSKKKDDCYVHTYMYTIYCKILKSERLNEGS